MLPSDDYGRYNRRWGLRLLLAVAVLLVWVTVGDSLDDYVGKYPFWLLPAVPAALSVLAALVATSLPRPQRAVFWGLMGVGWTLTALLGFVAFYAANFMRGKW